MRRLKLLILAVIATSACLGYVALEGGRFVEGVVQAAVPEGYLTSSPVPISCEEGHCCYDLNASTETALPIADGDTTADTVVDTTVH